MKELTLKCACGSEVISFTKDLELEIAIFSQKMYKNTLSGRIRIAWYALKGTLFNDTIILNEESERELKEFLK